METAGQDLCEELYQLSGWQDSGYAHCLADGDYAYVSEGDWTHEKFPAFHKGGRNTMGMESQFPAYPLGYLLRKLPPDLELDDTKYKLTLDCKSAQVWRASYCQAIEHRKGRNLVQNWKYLAAEGNTPEDAACYLAIELFKQGVLTREAKS